MAGACPGHGTGPSAPHWQGDSHSAPAHGQALHGGKGRAVRSNGWRPQIESDGGQGKRPGVPPWGRGRPTAGEPEVNLKCLEPWCEDPLSLVALQKESSRLVGLVSHTSPRLARLLSSHRKQACLPTAGSWR